VVHVFVILMKVNLIGAEWQMEFSLNKCKIMHLGWQKDICFYYMEEIVKEMGKRYRTAKQDVKLYATAAIMNLMVSGPIIRATI